MIGEPFRLTRGARMHGEVGGFVVKGGSFLDDPAIISSALRDEYPYFSSVGQGGEFRSRTIGLRVMLGSSILNQKADIEGLARASEAVDRQAAVTIAPKATAQLQELEAKAKGTTIGKDINSIRSQLGSELTQRSALERDLISSLLLNNAMMAREMKLTSNVIDVYFDFMTDETFSEAERAGYQEKFESNRKNLDVYASLFAASTQKIAGNYRDAASDVQPSLAHELTERGDTSLIDFLTVALESIDNYGTGRVVETRDMTDRIIGAGHRWW
jgi:hypothetical protein